MKNWTETNARTFARRRPGNGALTPRKRPSWMDEAACKNRTSLFFPGEHALGEVLTAKSICTDCPVVADCLDYALTFGEKDGVWGGLSAEERKRLRQRSRMGA